MDLDAYRVFVTLTKTQSFSKTAETLHMAQSTVSQRLQQLERDLGVALVVRGRAFSLTEAGRAFLPSAVAILEAEARGRSDVGPFVDRVEGPVLVAASQTAGGYVLPPILAEFAALHPLVRIHLRIANSDEVVEAVAGGAVDFGVIESPEASQRLVSVDWLEDPLVLVASPEHRVSEIAAPVPPAALRGLLLAVREPGSGTRDTLLAAWPGTLEDTFRLLELGSLAAIRQSVLAGRTLAFVSRWVVREDLAAGRLVVRTVEGVAPRRTMRLVRRREAFATRAARELHEALRRAAVAEQAAVSAPATAPPLRRP